jgi:hypothetical protein
MAGSSLYPGQARVASHLAAELLLVEAQVRRVPGQAEFVQRPCLDLLDGAIRFRALGEGEVPIADQRDRGAWRSSDVIIL